MPFVGLGAFLMLGGRTLRARALGQALAGFGVFFLGIDGLKNGFPALSSLGTLQDFIAPGLTGWLILIGIGTLLRVLMQASGAIIAIVILVALMFRFLSGDDESADPTGTTPPPEPSSTTSDGSTGTAPAQLARRPSRRWCRRKPR